MESRRDDMTAREHLRREHGDIMKALARFQNWIRDPAPPRDALRNALEAAFAFMDVYVDRCHHGKEEAILFPALEASGREDLVHLTVELRSDHGRARVLLDSLMAECRRPDAEFPADGFADRCEAYIALIRSHVRKENARLLPARERVLTDDARAMIQDAFERFDQGIDGLEGIRRAAGIPA
jgi:hemerythrin-like domain-containing protein